MPIVGDLTISPYTALYTNLVSDSIITTGTSNLQGREEIVLDFNSGQGLFYRDFATSFSWAIAAPVVLYTWQPSLIELPENTYNRATDWDDAGSPGNKLFRGFLLESDTSGNSKAITIQRAEDATTFTPNESPFTASRQSFKAFTFTPPFVSHQVRIISSDIVTWRTWGQKWVTDPWVEYATFDSAWSNLGFQGAKYLRGLVLPMDTKGLSAQFRVVTSDGGSVTFTATTPSAIKTVVSFAFTPPIVAHDVQIQCLTATAGAWVEEARWDFDKYPEIIPEYTPIMETGGAGAKYFRGMTLTADTANVTTSFQILYDGGQTGPVIIGTFNGKQTLAFAFTPFVFHDIQLVPQGNARIWIEESKWHYDDYPEITPEYTPIMEISGPDNKFVQGIKLIADTGNLPVEFQVLYDGGQTGPTFTGSFNGKQTEVFSWPPFLAHDLQLYPAKTTPLVSQSIFTSSGTFDADILGSTITVECIGGGGGGTGGTSGTCVSGGGGEYAKSVLTYASGTPITITVGAGGAGGAQSANGGNGGASSFGASVIANGGTGGVNGSGSSAGGTGGTGQTLFNGGNGTAGVDDGGGGAGGAGGPNGAGANGGGGGDEFTGAGGGGSGGGGVGGNNFALIGGTGGHNFGSTVAGGAGGTPSAGNGLPGGGDVNGASGGGGGGNTGPQGWGGAGGNGLEWGTVGSGGGGGGAAGSGGLPGVGGHGGLYGGGGGSGGFSGGLGGPGGQGIVVVTYAPSPIGGNGNARIWWGGIGQGASEWVFKPFPESTTNWTTELTSMGGIGWQHLRDINVEYISTTPITLNFTVDTGNGSIAPASLTIPSSSGTQTKQKILVSANKWKLLGFSATASSAFYLFAEGFEGRIRSWGDVGAFRISGPYRVTHPAGGPSAGGAEV